MAVTGMATGALAIFLAVVLLAAAGDDDGESFRPITVPYAQLNLGDCYQRPVTLEGEIEVRSCGRAHDRQAVGAVEHPAAPDASYPGETTLGQFAGERCRESFTRFVDAPDEQARLVADNLVPDHRSWASGSRHVVCAVRRDDGERLIGSVTDDSLWTVPREGAARAPIRQETMGRWTTT